MATYVNNFRTGYKIQIAWSTGTQSVSGNYTPVTASVQLVSTGSSYNINSSQTKHGSLTINGTAYAFTFTAQLSGNQTKTLFTKTVNVAHKSDGTKNLAISCSAGINVTLSGKKWTTVSASGSDWLTPIPRVSQISLNKTTASIDDSIVISTNRKSTAFTHEIHVYFGNWSAPVGRSVTTSYTWNIPNELANQIPNDTSGKGVIYLLTYANGKRIGTTSKEFTLTIPSSYKPSFTSVTASRLNNGGPASWTMYIQNLSKVKLTINGATGSLGSTIKKYSIKGTNCNSTLSSATIVCPGGGKHTYTATITDSRGRTATKSVTISSEGYHQPTIHYLKAERCDELGAYQQNGEYARVHYHFTICNVSGGVNNKAYYLQYRRKGVGDYVTIDSGLLYTLDKTYVSDTAILNVDYEYEFRLKVADSHAAIYGGSNVGTGFTLINFGADGKSIAFGKTADRPGAIDVNMRMYDNLSNSEITRSRYVYGNQPSGFRLTMDILKTDFGDPTRGMFLISAVNWVTNGNHLLLLGSFTGSYTDYSTYTELARSGAHAPTWRQSVQTIWIDNDVEEHMYITVTRLI